MINQALCNSFKVEILQGIHQPLDDYRMALYTSDADLSKDTAVYATIEEVAADRDYPQGGVSMGMPTIVLLGDVAIMDFEDVVIELTTITARGALIYNASKGNKAVAVLDFGKDISATDGTLTISLPQPSAGTALIRIA